jgi:hypothetical protein
MPEGFPIKGLEDPQKRKEVLRFNRELKKENKKQEKILRERFKNLEPYGLEKIEGIYSECIEQIEKESDYNIKKITIEIALREIDLRIKNSRIMYEEGKEGSPLFPDEPEDYFRLLDGANNFRKRLAIKIIELKKDELKAKTSIQKQTNGKSVDKTSSEADGLTSPTERDDEIMTKEEVKRRLKLKNVRSVSDMIKNEEIPYAFLGSRKVIIRSNFNAWLKNGMPKNSTQDIPETLHGNEENRHNFIFKVPLKPFTDAFVKERYLDEDNALLMIERFSGKPIRGDDKIIWKNDLLSLMTFIYLSDRLDYIDKSNSSVTRGHNSSNDERLCEYAKENIEIKYQPFVLENFELAKGKIEKTKIHRRWKNINNAVIKYCSETQTTESKKSNVDQVKKYNRRRAIEHYFKNPDMSKFKKNSVEEEDIDINILEIIGEIHNNKK